MVPRLPKASPSHFSAEKKARGNMAKFPALPLFTDAYLADTRHLTTLQHGAYLLLLMTAWRTKTCSLPDDDKQLARYASMGLATWKRNKDVLLSFFSKDKNGMWIQNRLTDEFIFCTERRNKNIKAGMASALKRHETTSTVVGTKTQRKANEPYPNPNPNPKEKKEPVKKKPSGRKKLEPDEYAFYGKVIRLTDEDYKKWYQNCSFPDKDQFYEHIDQRDEWLATQNHQKQTGWFMSTKKDLETRYPLCK